MREALVSRKIQNFATEFSPSFAVIRTSKSYWKNATDIEIIVLKKFLNMGLFLNTEHRFTYRALSAVAFSILSHQHVKSVGDRDPCLFVHFG